MKNRFLLKVYEGSAKAELLMRIIDEVTDPLYPTTCSRTMLVEGPAAFTIKHLALSLLKNGEIHFSGKTEKLNVHVVNAKKVSQASSEEGNYIIYELQEVRFSPMGEQ
jgi:hypothetical protein